MEIALLFGDIAYVSRRDMLEGIGVGAKKDGTNSVLFTCEGFMFHEFHSYSYGEYNIFKLPALEKYDGVIVDFESIQNPGVLNYLIDCIYQTEVPCVSIGGKIDGASSIIFDNKTGFEELIEHLIIEHNYQDIHFISGPTESNDAKERLEIFEKTLKKHGIKCTKNQIHEGNFNYISGKSIIVEYIASGKKMPDVFVAANDQMALGAIEELKRAGYRVPEDVAVTGYDAQEVALRSDPQLTTVDKNEKKAGMLAYELLKKKIKRGNSEEHIVVEAEPIFAETCGCKNVIEIDKSISVVEHKLHLDESLDLIKGMSIELTNLQSLIDIERCLERYVKKIGMEYFYFCQCGTRESYYEELETIASGDRVRRNLTQYQDLVWCPLAYENGEWNSYPSFNKNQLFPNFSKYKRESSYYVVMPVHQGKICLGYAIIGNFPNTLSGRVMQHLVLAIENAFGEIRNRDIMNTMLARVNQKWQYDELTGLLNRSGMNNNVSKLYHKIETEGGGIAVLFFDLDGLKAVNDEFGHEAGDDYIKSMATLLSENTNPEDLVVRYGGDEYIILSVEKSWTDTINKLEDIQKKIIAPMSASAGCVFDEEGGIEELNILIEEADRKMYEYKKRSKRAR